MFIPVKLTAEKHTQDEISIALGVFEASLHKFHVGHAREGWKFYTTGEKGLLNLYQEMEGRIYRDKKTLQKLVSWAERVNDPLLNRRFEILIDLFKSQQVDGENAIIKMETKLTEILISFRATLDGRRVSNNELGNIITMEPDRDKRRRAFTALAQVGKKMVPGLVRLIKKRNQTANSLNWKSYYSEKLRFNHIDEEFLFSLLEKLLVLSEDAYNRYLDEHRKELGIDKAESWDLSFEPSGLDKKLRRYFPKDQLLERVKTTYRNLGFDLNQIPIEIDADEREGKSQHGFCFPIDPPDDIRVLLNLDDGPFTANILLHEFGHGLYSFYGKHDEFVLRGAPTSFFNEAIANFLGDFSENVYWLKKYGDVPEAELTVYKRVHRFRKLRNLRASIARIMFERDAYQNPDQNLTQLYWNSMSKIMAIESHPELENWAGIIHYTSHPVYLQNYLVADLVAAQISAYLKKQQNSIIDNPETGKFLKEQLFTHAAVYPWDHLLEKITGQSLNPQFYIDEMLT